MSDVTTKQKQLVIALQSLTCFHSIESIVPITSGLSCYCFKLVADGKEFFAKYINSDFLNNEVKVAQLAANSKLTAQIIYHNQQWLICSFISGDNLNDSNLPQQEKATTAIALMAQCHTLKTVNERDISSIDINQITTDLIDSTKANYYTCQQLSYLKIAASQLKTLIELSSRSDNNITEDVCCHGDLNFSNILLDDNNKAWLIDFECSILAPAEFDIAMFIAINELRDSSLTDVIHQYKKQYNEHCPQRSINTELVSHYLLLCYFINALWYTNTSINREDESHHDNNPLGSLAKKQWQSFIYLATEIELSLDSSILEEYLKKI